VSPTKPGGESLFSRRVSLKWVLVAVTCLIVVMAAVIVIVLLVDRSRDNTRRAEAAAATSTTGVISPYDLIELPIGADLDVIEGAAFVSIYTPDRSGKLTSYGISSELPAAEALIDAVKHADEVSPEDSATALGSMAAESTITFVLPTRETLTFALYLEQGMIARGAQVWRPEADLKALVETAVSGPE
jgi:hypothetical protein